MQATDARGKRPRGRRDSIVLAAAELFAAKGFAGAGVDEIGASVGVTGPAIYRHFKGKEALLDAVVLATATAFAGDPALAKADAGVEEIVAGVVRTALDQPALVATYVRERHRLTGPARDELVSTERKIFLPWLRASLRIRPDVEERRMADRQLAALTAMSAIVTGRRPVARPHIDRLLSSSMAAVITAPGSDVRGAVPTQKHWQAPVSRRELILNHALHLFRERGFHGAGIDEIGEAAGITGPTIYFHYDSKSAILVDAFERAGTRVEAGVHDALTRAESARDALQRLAVSYAEVATDNIDLIVVTSREADALPDSDRHRLVRHTRQIRDAWTSVLAEIRPDLPEPMARTVVGGAFPLINQLAQRSTTPAESAQLTEAWLLAPWTP